MQVCRDTGGALLVHTQYTLLFLQVDIRSALLQSFKTRKVHLARGVVCLSLADLT